MGGQGREEQIGSCRGQPTGGLAVWAGSWGERATIWDLGSGLWALGTGRGHALSSSWGDMTLKVAEHRRRCVSVLGGGAESGQGEEEGGEEVRKEGHGQGADGGFGSGKSRRSASGTGRSHPLFSPLRSGTQAGTLPAAEGSASL